MSLQQLFSSYALIRSSTEPHIKLLDGILSTLRNYRARVFVIY